MIKPETTLLFRDKKVYIFLMVWFFFFFLTRQSRKLQPPFMCCLTPFTGRIAPFPALSVSSGTGSAAPGDQIELWGFGKGNAKAWTNASLAPSPTSAGARPSGGDRFLSFAAVPLTRREAGERGGGSREGGAAVQAAPAAPASTPTLRELTQGWGDGVETDGCGREKLCKASM